MLTKELGNLITTNGRNTLSFEDRAEGLNLLSRNTKKEFFHCLRNSGVSHFLLDKADPLVIHLHGNQEELAGTHHSSEGRSQLTAGCPYRLEDRRYVFTGFIVPVLPEQQKGKGPFAAEFHRLRGIRNKIQVYILSKQREHGKNSFCIKGLGKLFKILSQMGRVFSKV